MTRHTITAALCAALCAAAPAAATPKPVGLHAGEPAPYTGVLVAPDDARRCARLAIDIGATRRDLAECERRRAVVLPVACTPTVVRAERVVVRADRQWWLVAVAGIVGIAAGGFAGWRVSQ